MMWNLGIFDLLLLRAKVNPKEKWRNDICGVKGDPGVWLVSVFRRHTSPEDILRIFNGHTLSCTASASRGSPLEMPVLY
jgi:hypothetical protein